MRIEVEHRALRLTEDEWVRALYRDENPSAASDVIEGRLVEVGPRALDGPHRRETRPAMPDAPPETQLIEVELAYDSTCLKVRLHGPALRFATRPQPREQVVRTLMAELEGISTREDFVLLVATGTHRATPTPSSWTPCRSTTTTAATLTPWSGSAHTARTSRSG